MKREYVQPKIKMVDFCYDEQIVANSQEPGVEQKHDDVYCHYQMNTGCRTVVNKTSGWCDQQLWSLR